MQRKWFVSGLAALAVVAAAAGLSAGQLKSRPAEEWSERLERPDRVAGLKIDYIIASLGLKPGDVVADMGAGPGVLSLPIAFGVRAEQGFTELVPGARNRAFLVELGYDWR